MDHSHIHDDLIHILKERGYRVTLPRKKIIVALKTAVNPKTAKEIALRTKIKDFSTVYRTLAELVKEKLVSEFTDRGVSYFEISAHHHDHAVCISCGRVEHVPCMTKRKPTPLRSWKTLTHEALWRGVCSSCT